ncbi:hypothetical protein OAQ99_04495 [Candidatus Kapabacteria bacterium]|nr:hypothetical protein [Candidatus Kapabacteria bacterium]
MPNKKPIIVSQFNMSLSKDGKVRIKQKHSPELQGNPITQALNREEIEKKEDRIIMKIASKN